MPLLSATMRVSALCALLWLTQAHAAGTIALGRVVPPAQGSLCRAAAAAAEAARRVPDAFLSAIAKVESGRPDPDTGAPGPWPWTVNAEGKGSFYASKAEAISAVETLQARGVRSIDVGCLQVNLLHHPGAFASLEQAFDPAANAMYAAGFLVALFRQTGSWPLAAAAYHSQTPTIGAPYERRVLAEWAMPDTGAAQAEPRTHAARSAVHEADKETAEPASPQAAMVRGAADWAPIGRAPVTGQAGVPGAHAGGQTGRTLAAYRLLPVRLAARIGRSGF